MQWHISVVKYTVLYWAASEKSVLKDDVLKEFKKDKCKYLNDFDKRQIVKARHVGQSISRTTGLAVVRT